MNRNTVSNLIIPKIKIGKDGLISDGTNYYPVPQSMVGQEATLCISNSLVEVFLNDELVVSYNRINYKEPKREIKTIEGGRIDPGL